MIQIDWNDIQEEIDKRTTKKDKLLYLKRLIADLKQGKTLLSDETNNSLLARFRKGPGAIGYSNSTQSCDDTSISIQKVQAEIDYWESSIDDLIPCGGKNVNKNKKHKSINPIQWNGSVAQIEFLFENLVNKGLIPATTDTHAAILSHFTNKGNPFSASSLRQTKQRILNQDGCKGSQVIDEILSSVEKKK